MRREAKAVMEAMEAWEVYLVETMVVLAVEVGLVPLTSQQLSPLLAASKLVKVVEED